MGDIKQLVIDLGKKLDFDVETEVPASESAWVDVVWYDKRLRSIDRLILRRRAMKLGSFF